MLNSAEHEISNAQKYKNINSFAVLSLAGIPETDESFAAEELSLSCFHFYFFVRHWLKKKLLKAKKNKYIDKEDE